MCPTFRETLSNSRMHLCTRVNTPQRHALVRSRRQRHCRDNNSNQLHAKTAHLVLKQHAPHGVGFVNQIRHLPCECLKGGVRLYDGVARPGLAYEDVPLRHGCIRRCLCHQVCVPVDFWIICKPRAIVDTINQTMAWPHEMIIMTATSEHTLGCMEENQ